MEDRVRRVGAFLDVPPGVKLAVAAVAGVVVGVLLDADSEVTAWLGQRHALLAYLYGTVIVALLVNLVAGLAG